MVSEIPKSLYVHSLKSLKVAVGALKGTETFFFQYGERMRKGVKVTLWKMRTWEKNKLSVFLVDA